VNVNFAVTWLHGAVEARGRIFLRHGAILLRSLERGRGRPRYSRPGGRRYIRDSANSSGHRTNFNVHKAIAVLQRAALATAGGLRAAEHPHQ
jgi:hypothetical protein